MPVLTKNALMICFDVAKDTKAKYIGVAIETRGSDGYEVIINPRCNFEAKQKYYRDAYNEQLVLLSYDGICIKGFCYGDSYEEIHTSLNVIVEGGID